MATDPLILALANPEPEILPELAKAVRPDAIIATGRSDYPNQVNNVLCFPFIFRGALDVGATTINEAMKLACVRAIAELAHVPSSRTSSPRRTPARSVLRPRIPDPQAVRSAPHRDRAAGRGEGGDGQRRRHAAHHRLRSLPRAPVAVHLSLRAHHEAGVRRRQARTEARRLFAEGEEERVLRAVQVVVDEGLARPILIGRPEVIAARIEKFGLRIAAGKDFELVNINNDPRYRRYWQRYYQLMGRIGISPEDAKEAVLRKPSLIGTLLLRDGRVRCAAVRHGRQVPGAPPPRGRRHRPTPDAPRVRGDERPAAAQPHAVHLRHLRERESLAPRNWPRSRTSRPKRSAASASRPRWRCCRTPISAARLRIGTQDARGAAIAR